MIPFPPTTLPHVPLPRLSSHSFPVSLHVPFRLFYLIIMASKTVATKSHKKSHTGKASTTMEGCKKTGHVQKKTAAAMASEAQQSEASDDEPEEPLTDATAHRAPAQVVWDKYPVRTDRLLDYLDAHSNVAIKLFGDSTKVAKSEGRFKLTAKSNKSAGYLQVAEGIFSIDEDAAV